MKPTTLILPTHTPALFHEAVHEAARRLTAGEVVAVPTETVYGLAANALDPDAVRRIYEIKGRPAHNPIIVHAADLHMARECAAAWPPLADTLAASFWPGPLTLVVPRSSAIPDVVTAGGSTVGVRWPSHPFMRALMQTCGFPLAAPSANPSNQISPTRAEHVARTLHGRVGLIIDGGCAQVGIESTVLDITQHPPRLLRPGMIHAESILAVTGSLLTGQTGDATLRSPGLLAKHYAPQARLVIASWENEQQLHAVLQNCGGSPETTHILVHRRIPTAQNAGRVCVIPHDPDAFGRALYAELHRCDETGAGLILVEAPPDEPGWSAIHDRLRRAAS